MKTVRQLLQVKGYETASIESNKSLYDAMQLMAAKNIGALLVLESERLIGIITERDYSRKMHLLDKLPYNILVKEIMTNQVAT